MAAAVVFDFDKTILDCDSDDWVVDSMGLTDIFDELLPTMSYNSLMNRMMKELHSQGKTIEDIANCLIQAPLHPNIISAIKSAHASGCDLRILSDANTFFIETILKHHGILDCFAEINTNPGFVDGEGKLVIFPFHEFKSSSHSCILCPPNLCKGMVLERIQRSELCQAKQIIYVGDGKNDFCPSMKLSARDYVMPRKNLKLWDMILADSSLVKAQIHGWNDGEELKAILVGLISLIHNDQHNRHATTFYHEFIPVMDCKAETTLISGSPVAGSLLTNAVQLKN
ncbi:hypothetical protein Droror1_Dr00017719 [Drosera rotundifolia]